jgi:hypothetical protein
MTNLLMPSSDFDKIYPLKQKKSITTEHHENTHYVKEYPEVKTISYLVSTEILNRGSPRLTGSAKLNSETFTEEASG